MTIENSETESKPKREKLNHVQFDIQYYNKPKMRAFRKEFLNDGLVAYMDLQLAIADSTNAEIRFSDAISIVKEWLTDQDQAIPMIDYLVERGMLLRYATGGIDWISHPRIAEAQESLFVERERWRSYKKRKYEDSTRKPKRKRRESLTQDQDQSLTQTQDQSQDHKKEIAPKVLLSATDIEGLGRAMPADELNYWITQCSDAAQSKPRKWATYKDHAAVIRSWRNLKLESGKAWNPKTKLYEKPNGFHGNSSGKQSAAQRNQQTTFDAVKQILEEERERGNI